MISLLTQDVISLEGEEKASVCKLWRILRLVDLPRLPPPKKKVPSHAMRPVPRSTPYCQIRGINRNFHLKSSFWRCHTPSLFGASLSLLLDVRFSATLQRLAGVVLLLVLSLGSLISREAGDSTADSSGDTVTNAGAQVGKLAAGLLLLSLEVLLATRAL